MSQGGGAVQEREEALRGACRREVLYLCLVQRAGGETENIRFLSGRFTRTSLTVGSEVTPGNNLAFVPTGNVPTSPLQLAAYVLASYASC